jgi:hypothetical protein
MLCYKNDCAIKIKGHTMSLTRERFEQGLTYDEYVAQMTINRERFEAIEASVALEEGDVAFFRQLPQPLNVLVLTEDWCEPAITSIPVLGSLAKATQKLNIRIFLRDENLELMDEYLKDGRFRVIPIFVLYDNEYTELGRWYERPAKIVELVQQMRQELFAQDPVLSSFAPDSSFAELAEAGRARLAAALRAFGEAHQELSNRELVRELREILSPTLVQPGETPGAEE